MTKKANRRDQVTASIAQHILQTGLSQTSLRQLAAAAGNSDRMLLYYFKDKEEVMSASLAYLANGMTLALNTAISGDEKLTPLEFFNKTAPLVRGGMFGPMMELWIEISAAAVQGEEPYKRVSQDIAADFLKWVEDRLLVENETERKAQAAMLLTMIDGLALMGICMDDDVQARASEAMAQTLFRAKL
jgi:AcrR family transcriptional regulator